MSYHQTCNTHVNHSQNTVSHSLANYANVEGRTNVWFISGPANTTDLCNEEC
jgi:hypothetical protein